MLYILKFFFFFCSNSSKDIGLKKKEEDDDDEDKKRREKLKRNKDRRIKNEMWKYNSGYWGGGKEERKRDGKADGGYQ